VLKDEFKMAIEAIDKEHIGAMAQRVGLRYVNNFAIDGVNLKEWKKFIFRRVAIYTNIFRQY